MASMTACSSERIGRARRAAWEWEGGREEGGKREGRREGEGRERGRAVEEGGELLAKLIMSSDHCTSK